MSIPAHFGKQIGDRTNGRQLHSQATISSHDLCFVIHRFSIDDKCAACNAVAEELEHGLANEKPRNHLDMRYRLDSTGQREGKVIDYRVSELRVVELLDGLCDKMQDYTLTKAAGSTGKEWVRVKSWNDLTINECYFHKITSLAEIFVFLKISKQEAKAYSKDISSYCGRLLEETEDELAEMIKRGSVKPGGVSKVLCQDISRHCKQKSVTDNSDSDESDDDESKAEL
ncbi:protein canopy-1-like [Phyllobates terribilis]|uniref:protein canopy-1-like n=1 Tax=Phyllobates terribilis TaxID=111132 RepID=UPI003CCA9762